MKKTGINNFKSSLSIDNAPLAKQLSTHNKKLGLINKNKKKNFTFLLAIDALEDLKEISKETSERLNMKVTQSYLIEATARHLRKFPAEVIKIIKASMNIRGNI